MSYSATMTEEWNVRVMVMSKYVFLGVFERLNFHPVCAERLRIRCVPIGAA